MPLRLPELVDDEIGNAEFIIQLRVAFELLRCNGRLYDSIEVESGLQEAIEVRRKRSMEVRDGDAYHCPIALPFVKITIKDDVLLRPIVGLRPSAHR